MLTKNIFFQNFKTQSKKQNIKNYLNKIIKYDLNNKKNLIFSFSDKYKYSYSKKKLGILKKKFSIFNIIGMGGSILGSKAIYYFLSGYTSKVAGTERGIAEPQATFSSSFGSAFLTLHPIKYAQLFEKKLKKHQTNIYLVNTGWIGGPYGIGQRININDTRKCIDSILSGEIVNNKFSKDPIFNLNIPIHIDGIDQNILIPENSWENKNDYHKYAFKLSNMFKDNYNKLFRQTNIKDYSIFGPN